jgi:hypothetical protein
MSFEKNVTIQSLYDSVFILKNIILKLSLKNFCNNVGGLPSYYLSYIELPHYKFSQISVGHIRM